MSLLKELLLMEAPKPTKAKVAGPKMDDIFDDEFHSPSAAPAATPASKARQGGSLRDAIAAHQASGGTANAPSINYDALNDLEDEGDDDVDVPGRPDPEPEPPKEPGQDLANQTQDVRAAGKANADWMTVDQLPGYMQTGIRRMGRIVFKPLTKTNMQDISVLANLGGQGPSSKMDLNAVAHYAQKNAHETRDLAMTFGDMIPGYEPEAKLYVTAKDTYLVVQDEMGQYIYSWESKDTKDAFVKSIEDGSTNELE